MYEDYFVRKAILRYYDGTIIDPVIIIKESKYRYLVEHTEWEEHSQTGQTREKRTVHKWYWKKRVTPYEHN